MAELGILEFKARSAYNRIIDLSELSKQIYDKKQPYPVSQYCKKNVTDATSIRELIINGIRAGMFCIPLDIKHKRGHPIPVLSASASDSEIACWIAENDLKDLTWEVDLHGIDPLYLRDPQWKSQQRAKSQAVDTPPLREPLLTNQQACWALLFEEWTSNAVKGSLEDQEPAAFASISIQVKDGSLVCDLRNGPVDYKLLENNTSRGGAHGPNIGTMIMGWCIFDLTGCTTDDHTECFNKPRKSASHNCVEWALGFTIPENLWRPK